MGRNLPKAQSQSVPPKGSKFSPRTLLKFGKKKPRRSTALQTSQAVTPHSKLGVSAETQVRLKPPSLLKKLSSPISTMFSGSRSSLPDAVQDEARPVTPEAPSKVTVGLEDVGKRVAVKGYQSHGVLLFYGRHEEHGRIRCGVVLDTATGRNNGTVQGHTYFSCEENRGILVVPEKVALCA